jgi:hypothetical protein
MKGITTPSGIEFTGTECSELFACYLEGIRAKQEVGDTSPTLERIGWYGGRVDA